MLFLVSYPRLPHQPHYAKVFRTSVWELGVYLNDESKIDFMAPPLILAS